MVKMAIIPAAGLGTRLLPATKETPKEMLPVFYLGNDGAVYVKPLLQAVFEQLFDHGIREFCFVVGRGKKSISDHFTSDRQLVTVLNKAGREALSHEIQVFYRKLDTASIAFVNQPEPKGFGDAILRAEPYVKGHFLVQAGDTLIVSADNSHLRRLTDVHERFGNAATFLVQEVGDPRPFGVIKGSEVSRGVYRVEKVIEKPQVPPSNLAVTAVYIFTSEIFRALRSTPVGFGGELQLTDGIQKMIDLGLDIMAVRLKEDESWLDVGDHESYWSALRRSYTLFQPGSGLDRQGVQRGVVC